jgi:hypothetical protein
MKMSDDLIYSFSKEKNATLKEQRGIGFDDIIFLLENGCLLGIKANPSESYPHQEVLIIKVEEYVYIVPFVRNGNEVFMKTIYPSRSFTKKYLNK